MTSLQFETYPDHRAVLCEVTINTKIFPNMARPAELMKQMEDHLSDDYLKGLFSFYSDKPGAKALEFRIVKYPIIRAVNNKSFIYIKVIIHVLYAGTQCKFDTQTLRNTLKKEFPNYTVINNPHEEILYLHKLFNNGARPIAQSVIAKESHKSPVKTAEPKEPERQGPKESVWINGIIKDQNPIGKLDKVIEKARSAGLPEELDKIAAEDDELEDLLVSEINAHGQDSLAAYRLARQFLLSKLKFVALVESEKNGTQISVPAGLDIEALTEKQWEYLFTADDINQ